jgi:hypothetical protein
MTGPQPMNAGPAARLRLDVVKEILTALETATAAGQQYLMGKVLKVLQHQAPPRDHWLNDREWSQIVGAFDALAREATRLSPDPAAFSRQAQFLADSFSRTARTVQPAS